MGFLVVEFSNRLKEYAVVTTGKLVDGNMRALKSKIIGKTVDLLWGRETYSVKVRGFGTKTAMEVLCDSLAEEAANAEIAAEETVENDQKRSGSKNSCAGRIFNILNERKRILDSTSGQSSKANKLVCVDDQQTPSGETNEEVVPQDQTSTRDMEEQSEEDPRSTISRLEAKVEKLKESVRKHKERAKELNRQVLELQEQHNLASSEVVSTS
ncbi:unnamed protein product [Allacma fusca]|uniref:Uncharacterized protein n=1 Tax=Allacma fusca TaxID=39272 RepID=A0A8J2JR50_9HEXA|nr:unnamed protein product [Allacma fusca]